jgi:hypothetical protein
MQKDPEATPIGDSRPDADRARPDSDPPPNGLPSGSADRPQPDSNQATTGWWVTVQGAADALGITVEAVRARTRRGTLRKEKASDGTVHVWLETDHYQPDPDRTVDPSHPDVGGITNRIQQDEDRTTDRPQPEGALVEALRDHLDVLCSELEDRKEEARRKDAIIMSLSQRIPELSPPAPEGAQDWPETATDVESRDDAPSKPQEPSQRRSWLYRFFFGP